MNRELITQAVEKPGAEAINALIEDETTVFWVDWKDREEDIVASCEQVLRTGRLEVELQATDSEGEFDVYIRFAARQVKVPLVGGAEDCHIILCSLNEALWPDFEVRYCIDTGGSDTLGFLPLPATDWRHLDRQYGEALEKRFYKVALRPNLFTDSLPYPLDPYAQPEGLPNAGPEMLTPPLTSTPIVPEPVQNNPPQRKWWQFWS